MIYRIIEDCVLCVLYLTSLSLLLIGDRNCTIIGGLILFLTAFYIKNKKGEKTK